MNYFILVPVASLAALVCAFYFFRSLMKKDEGTLKMKTIAGFIREGAMSYLKQQYKVVIIVFIILALIFAFLGDFNQLIINSPQTGKEHRHRITKVLPRGSDD